MNLIVVRNWFVGLVILAISLLGLMAPAIWPELLAHPDALYGMPMVQHSVEIPACDTRVCDPVMFV